VEKETAEQRQTLPQQRAQETRRRLLEAARHMFARRGYGQATVDDIVLEAGTSKGAFYHHFASKEELFKLLLGDHTRELEDLGRAVARASSFRDVLEQIVALWLDHYSSDPDFVSLSLEFRVQATREEWSRRALGGSHQQMRDGIAELLRIAQQGGLIRSDLDPEDAAVLFFGLLDGVCLQWGVDPVRLDLTKIQQPLIDAIEAFLGVTDAAPADVAKVQAALVECVERMRRRAAGGHLSSSS
jgi:AcrR family transcriptional regulator